MEEHDPLIISTHAQAGSYGLEANYVRGEGVGVRVFVGVRLCVTGMCVVYLMSIGISWRQPCTGFKGYGAVDETKHGLAISIDVICMCRQTQPPRVMVAVCCNQRTRMRHFLAIVWLGIKETWFY